MDFCRKANAFFVFWLRKNAFFFSDKKAFVFPCILSSGNMFGGGRCHRVSVKLSQEIEARSCFWLYCMLLCIHLLNLRDFLLHFTALHGMLTRSSNENSARPSVCPSDKKVNCDKTEGKSVKIFIPCERSFSLVFWEKERLMEEEPLLSEILGKPAPVGAKSPILNR